MTFNLGGDIAAFGSDLGVRQSVSLQTRLDWCLGDAEDWLEGKGKGEGECDEDITAVAARSEEGGTVASGGAGLTLGEGFEPLRKAIHDSPDIREWVLQDYVERPLLAEGRKFHLRAYVLAGLWVHLFDDILLLRAAKPYPCTSGGAGGGGSGTGGGREAFCDEDPLAHITNTARQAEDKSFSEEENVWVLGDMVGELERQGRSSEDALAKVDAIAADVRALTVDLFRAFRGEFAVFSPLPGCFEHFGLDFMVDEDFHVWLLEANPGPDFKQARLRDTGSRLKHVIGDLVEDTMRICLDQRDEPCHEATSRVDVAQTSRDTPPSIGGAARGGGGSGRQGGAGGGEEGQGGGGEGERRTRTRFSMILDEQWRGTSAAPSMKML
eukprot:jgi/Undpi1/2075/HiC_scaffold_12.g05461.m1